MDSNAEAPIQAFMLKHGLSQSEVAAATGVTQSAVSYIANGKRKPTSDTINRLLPYFRRFEPRLTYEALFAPELLAGRRGRVA